MTSKCVEHQGTFISGNPPASRYRDGCLIREVHATDLLVPRAQFPVVSEPTIVRYHGNPSYGETQEWIRTNTKPCPGCRVGIQKGEACFHMTCTQCSYEFCWQCLANWTEIRAHGQQGHVDACYFRTNDVRPTGLRGENLEDALRARTG
ncbi:hypothetical protein LZ554_003435 [Drepanopeziza brunnea f. sp. 'monogermtubi']|nr:hypothetical protein LZ554_003435 [Drepanopeziza brunnea f. sp. 'monogermtubi']